MKTARAEAKGYESIMSTVWMNQNEHTGTALTGQPDDAPPPGMNQKAKDSALPGMLMAVGVVILTVMALSNLRRRMRQQSRQTTLDPRERIESFESEAKKRQLVEGYMANAEELTARLAAHMDNKAAWLEKLMEDADERIRRLELIEHRSAQESSQASGAQLEPGEDPMKLRIYALADQGLPPLEIARQLDQHTGKVELVLALRRA